LGIYHDKEKKQFLSALGGVFPNAFLILSATTTLVTQDCHVMTYKARKNRVASVFFKKNLSGNSNQMLNPDVEAQFIAAFKAVRHIFLAPVVSFKSSIARLTEGCP